MALKLGADNVSLHVPVQVKDGIPPPIRLIIDLPPEVLRLLLMQSKIGHAVPGVSFVREHYDDVVKFLQTSPPPTSPAASSLEVALVETLLQELTDALRSRWRRGWSITLAVDVTSPALTACHAALGVDCSACLTAERAQRTVAARDQSRGAGAARG